MKKWILSCLILLLCVGCQPNEYPAGMTLAHFLDAFRNEKIEQLDKYFTDGLPLMDEIKSITDLAIEENKSVFLEKLTDLNWSLMGRKESYYWKHGTKRAIVNVKLTSNNIYNQLVLGYKEAQIISQDFSLYEISRHEMDNEALKALFDSLKECEKNYTTYVNVTLSKVNGEWLIDTEGNDDFFEAISGRLTAFPDYVNNH